MMDSKLADRISKLQAMADDASSENEAMIAARRLHALLARHGITAADLADTDDDALGESDYSVTRKMGGGLWSKLIGQSLASLYFCRAYTMATGGTSHKMYIVGRRKYRDTAAMMARAVTVAVDTEARLSSRRDRPKGQDGWAWITSFRNAAADRIQERCAEMMRAARKGELEDEDGNTLPVLASMYDTLHTEAMDWLHDHVPLQKGRAKTRQTSREGSEAGRKFGSSVRLGNEIGNHAPKGIGHDKGGKR